MILLSILLLKLEIFWFLTCYLLRNQVLALFYRFIFIMQWRKTFSAEHITQHFYVVKCFRYEHTQEKKILLLVPTSWWKISTEISRHNVILCSLFSYCFTVIMTTHLRIHYMFTITSVKWMMPMLKFMIVNKSLVAMVFNYGSNVTVHYRYTCWYSDCYFKPKCLHLHHFICTVLQY